VASGSSKPRVEAVRAVSLLAGALLSTLSPWQMMCIGSPIHTRRRVDQTVPAARSEERGEMT